MRTKPPIRLGPPPQVARPRLRLIVRKDKDRPKPRRSVSPKPTVRTGNDRPPSPPCHDEYNDDDDGSGYSDDDDGFGDWYYDDDEDGCVDSSGHYFDDANDMFAYGDCDWGSN